MLRICSRKAQVHSSVCVCKTQVHANAAGLGPVFNTLLLLLLLLLRTLDSFV